MLSSEYNEPHNLQEARHHKYIVEREGWCTSTQNKLKDTINKGVCRKPKRINMPPNRRIIDSKWVFKKKRDGQFSALLVARGYDQIPGVDFTENSSPVATDIKIRVILLMRLIKNGTTRL